MTNVPYWLLPTILLFPATLWMFLGVGIPWALAILPRSDWRSRIVVVAVALALGPAFTAAVVFLIGAFGQFTSAKVLGSSVRIAAIGLALPIRNRSCADAPANVADS